MRTAFLLAASLILLIASPLPSEAGMIRLSVTGKVFIPDQPTKPFELADGDTVRLMATFDERPEGGEQFVFGEGGNGSLSFEIGKKDFTEQDDKNFTDAGIDGPVIEFGSGGQLVDIDLLVVDEDGAEIFNSDTLSFAGQGNLLGDWDPDSASFTAVPVPASLNLILPALISVWFLRLRARGAGARRRQSAAGRALSVLRPDGGGVSKAADTRLLHAI